MSKGSDFCDTCTAYMNGIETAPNEDVKTSIAGCYKNHRIEAANEFKMYKQLMAKAESNTEGESVHIIFDFAEKVLLPYLIIQPGQLHFTTSLKFDLFGIHFSNYNQSFMFGLVEGHWPNKKSGNEVASMIYYFLDLLKDIRTSEANIKHIDMSADNCGGQNKNRFMLWFCCWLVICGVTDSIFMRFLIPGHTKNRVDGAFGLVKRKLKRSNVLVPSDMMTIIEDSADTNNVICGSDVLWYSWQKILEPYFRYPPDFKITKYQVFEFDNKFPGQVRVRNRSTSTVVKCFNLFK